MAYKPVMTVLDIFSEFNEKLLYSLPMKDVTFLAKLTSLHLFPGDLKAQVKAKSTSAEAADHFLENTIEKDLRSNNNESFMKLLSAMEEFSSQLRDLASNIKIKIRDDLSSKEQSSITTG